MPRHKFKSLSPYNPLVSECTKANGIHRTIRPGTVSNHTHNDDTKKAPSPYMGYYAFLKYQIVSSTDDPTMGTGQLAAALQCMTCVFCVFFKKNLQ